MFLSFFCNASIMHYGRFEGQWYVSIIFSLQSYSVISVLNKWYSLLATKTKRNHLMDWYYLIHKYNTKSSRAKLGDTGKKINYWSWTLYFSNDSIISKSVLLLRLTSVCPSQLKTYSQRADNKDIWFCYEINEKLDRRRRFTILHHWPTGFVRNRQFSAF